MMRHQRPPATTSTEQSAAIATQRLRQMLAPAHYRPHDTVPTAARLAAHDEASLLQRLLERQERR